MCPGPGDGEPGFCRGGAHALRGAGRHRRRVGSGASRAMNEQFNLSTRFGSVRFGQPKAVNSAQVNQPGSVQINWTRITSVQISLAQISSEVKSQPIWISLEVNGPPKAVNSVQVNQPGSIRFGSIGFGLLQFGSVRE